MVFHYEKDKEEFIIQDATHTEYHQLALWFTRYTKGYQFTPAFKMGVWNGTETYFNKGRIKFGLWQEIRKVCNMIDSPFHIDNMNELPLNNDIKIDDIFKFCEEFFKDHKVYDKVNKEWLLFYPYYHQMVCAFKILKSRFSIAEVATSGGKTLIISIVIFYLLTHIKPSAKILIIVPSITLVSQFRKDIIEYNISQNNQNKNKSLHSEHQPLDIRISEIMSDKPNTVDDPNIMIGTFQSLVEYDKKFFNQFDCIIVDEAHKATAASIKKIIKRTVGKAYMRFGVSGTFPPEDSAEILAIQSILGPKIAEVTAKELMNLGVITPMKIKAIMMNHNDIEFAKKLKQIKKYTVGTECYLLEKEYIHQSKKRTEFITKIIDNSEGNILLLFHTIEYGLELFQLLKDKYNDTIDLYYIDGEIKNKERNEIKSNMDKVDGKQKILVASFGTLSTGVSIKNIYNVIFADSFKSESLILQSIGRALRKLPGKDQATIYDLVDIFEPTNPRNIFFKQYKERAEYYTKKQYPYKEYKINL